MILLGSLNNIACKSDYCFENRLLSVIIPEKITSQKNFFIPLYSIKIMWLYMNSAIWFMGITVKNSGSWWKVYCLIMLKGRNG